MQLPAQLLRRNSRHHKNKFGHVLVLAGSQRMIGAGALTSLSALRSGAGLVTLGIPRELNLVAQRKIAPEVMTWPLSQTSQQSLSSRCLKDIRDKISTINALAIGPGLSTHQSTANLVNGLVKESLKPLVIDADGINCLGRNPKALLKTTTPKILTPHPGEMARLLGKRFSDDDPSRKSVAKNFAQKFQVILLLKGHRTVVASPQGKCYINKTGNSGMATAGSGDVLTGMIAGFCAQGINAFEAAVYGAWLHGLAGDLASKKLGKASLMASDIIDHIPKAIQKSQ